MNFGLFLAVWMPQKWTWCPASGEALGLASAWLAALAGLPASAAAPSTPTLAKSSRRCIRVSPGATDEESRAKPRGGANKLPLRLIISDTSCGHECDIMEPLEIERHQRGRW